MNNPDCDCPGGSEFCQLGEPCPTCQQEILEQGIESAQQRAELDHDRQEAEDLR